MKRGARSSKLQSAERMITRKLARDMATSDSEPVLMDASANTSKRSIRSAKKVPNEKGTLRSAKKFKEPKPAGFTMLKESSAQPEKEDVLPLAQVVSPAQGASTSIPSKEIDTIHQPLPMVENVLPLAQVDSLALDVPCKEIETATAGTIIFDVISSKQGTLMLASERPDDGAKNSNPNDEFPSQSIYLGLLEVAKMFADNASSEHEVVASVSNSALVSVQGYRVKQAVVHTLTNIFDKYGDIAANCLAMTVESRSLFLERICEVVQALQVTKFGGINEGQVKNMLALISDFEILKLEVSWLSRRLEELLEAIKLMKEYPSIKEIHAKNSQIIQESKKALKGYKAEILEHKCTMQKLEEKTVLEEKKLSAAVAEVKKIRERLSLEPKVSDFFEYSMLHGLL